jgi:squalene-associated FAD-dependent desaturase
VNPVVVVGGGLSGLAAAVSLSSRRIPVLLLEQRKSPGGRASSFVDESTGTVIDNGQHVLIAGYSRTMEFLGTIGARGLVAVQPVPELLFHHPVRGFCSFRLPLLPSPLHFLAGVVTTGLFSPADKLRMLRAGFALRSSRPVEGTGETVESWLDSLGQSPETKRSFWEPLAVAVMNEHLETASAVVFIRALRTAFLSGARGSALAIPTVGLNELYVDPARAYIERCGGVVRCSADVTGSVAEGGKISGIRLKEGETIGCSAVILAVPSYRAAGLLPDALRESGFLACASSIPLSPIVSVHLWFRGDVMPQDVLGVVGRRIQWVFNRRKISREKGEGGHLSVVISAARAFVGMENDELARIALEDLRSVFGAVIGDATHAVVIREKRATISCAPDVEPLRPGSITPLPNLFIAGDWTGTGYPATIEGAVMSGQHCADLAAGLTGGIAGGAA